MDRFIDLEKIFKDLKYIGSKNCFESTNKGNFLIKDGIPDLFIDDGDKITNKQKDFYEDIKF